MQKYGVMTNGKLQLVSKETPGAKPIHYAPVPEYDQSNQAVFEGAIVDEGDYISVSVVIVEVEQDDNDGQDML